MAKERRKRAAFRKDDSPDFDKSDDERLDILTDGMKSITSYGSNIFSLDDLDDTSKVLPIEPICLQWLLDSNGILLSKIYTFEGDPGAGKSQFGYQIGKIFIESGGIFVLIETENKTSSKTLAATFGIEFLNNAITSKRFRFHQCFSIDEVESLSDSEKAGAWQSAVRDWIKAVNTKLPDKPVFILVDSMVGAAGSDTFNEYAEKGNMQGRGFDQAARANSIGKFLQCCNSDLAKSNITLAFTNHLKEGVADATPGRNIKIKTAPGGRGPQFHATYRLWFEKGAAHDLAGKVGRQVHIRVFKNSFGVADRRLTVPFYTVIAKDANGNVIKDKFGNPVRSIYWDWNESNAQLFFRYCSNQGSDYVAAAGKILDVVQISNKWSSKRLGADKISPSEFGKMLNDSDDLYEEIKEIVELAINQYPLYGDEGNNSGV